MGRRPANRQAWAWRLLGCRSTPPAAKTEIETGRDTAFTAALRTTDGYRWGVLWLLAATLAPTAFVALTNDDGTAATVGLQLALGTTFGLLAAVLLRSGGEVGVVTQFFAMLVHWSIYAWRDRLPPWVFRSPCGGWPRRQLTTLLLVGLLSLPITCLAARSFAQLLASAERHTTITQLLVHRMGRGTTGVVSLEGQLMALHQGNQCFTKWTHVEPGQVIPRRLHRIVLQPHDGGPETITCKRRSESGALGGAGGRRKIVALMT